MEARELSPNPRSPKSQQIGTPQKGISNVEKLGRGGLKPKRSLEVRGSFNDDDIDDDDKKDNDGSIGYTSWKNDFFNGFPETYVTLFDFILFCFILFYLLFYYSPLKPLSRQESDGLRSTSPESLSIIDSYQPINPRNFSAPKSNSSISSPPQVIPIIKKSYYNRTVEDIHPEIPTLNDFVKVCEF